MSLLDDAQDWLPALRTAFRRAAEASGREVSPRWTGPDVSTPVHTLYWGAHRLDDAALSDIAAQARDAFQRHGSDPDTLGDALGFPASPELRARVHSAVQRKMDRDPVEDLRVDFEDGYGRRPDAEEDAAAQRSARVMAHAVQAGTAPRRFGIRVKALTPELAPRSLTTIERFVTELCDHLGGAPPELVVTLPKVTVTEQLEAADALLARLEARLGLPTDTLGLETMIEVPNAVFDAQGRLAVSQLRQAAPPRLIGVHLGVYDYTAAHGITAMHQGMDHPACDLVRGLAAMAFAGSNRVLSAGSTNVLPVGPHDDPSTPQQQGENRQAVHRAWRLAHTQIRHTLVRGFYHGWDLHPAQLPIRFATCYRFYLEGIDAAASRLRNVIEAASGATDDAAVLDDVATGQALLSWFRRAYQSGALQPDDLTPAGLTPATVMRPFADLLTPR